MLRVFKNPASIAIWVTVLSLVLWLGKVVFLDQISERVFWGSEFGKVFEAVVAAIVTGFVFHLFYSRLNDLDQRRHLLPYLERHLQRVRGDCEGIIQQISLASQEPLRLQSIDRSAIENALKKIAFESQPEMVVGQEGRPATWIEFFEHYRRRTQRSIGRLLQQASYIDAQTSACLVEIDDCHLFNQLEQLGGYKLRNKDLSFLASSFSQYCDLCRKIEP